MKPALLAFGILLPLLSAAGFIRMLRAVEGKSLVRPATDPTLVAHQPALSAWRQDRVAQCLALVASARIPGQLRNCLERRRSTKDLRERKTVHNTPMQIADLERLLTVNMPFGKYKGRLIADLPGHYLNWFAREGFPRGELGRLLALMHEMDHNGLRDLLEPLRKRG